jgi:fructosamine-3-kinase
MIPSRILKGLEEYFSTTQSSGFQLLSSKPLGGGSINEVFYLKSAQGDFCLKFNRSDVFPGMFQTEARGLKLLSGPKVIRIPEVICCQTLSDYSFILLEYIRSSDPVSYFYEDFGRRLAAVHKNHGELYGLDYNNYMGSLRQNNCFHTGWVEFFINERLDKQVRLAAKNGLLSNSIEKQFDRLYARLDELLPEEPPCLVHGDLWSGNFMVSEEGHACLIDPAVYYGNREVDLAMSTLFGGFSPDFYASYAEAYPLIPGWKYRLELYNLYPLLIHLNLFGTGYLGSILSVLQRF